jgi:hypothetical protein
LVDIKRVSQLEFSNKPIKTAEQVISYLTKYLTKSFQMRQNKEFAVRFGLLKGAPLYKFFRVIYNYYTDKKNGVSLTYIQEKIKKPFTSSHVFINDDYVCNKVIESELTSYFDNDMSLKKETRCVLVNQEFCFHQQSQRRKLVDFLKLCLRYSSKNKVKKNQF